MKQLLLKWFHSGLAKLVLLITLLVLAGTVGFYLLEHQAGNDVGIATAAWWTIVTLTTVGYGDFVPTTPLGRALGALVMIGGIGLVSAFTGSLASLLVEQKAKKRKGLLAVKLHSHIVIMGWNGFAYGLVNTLIETGALNGVALVLVNNLTEEERSAIAFKLNLGDRLHFIWGDIAQESVVHKARPEHAQVVYILSQQNHTPREADQQTIYAALTTRSLAPNVQLFGEVTLPENRDHLLRAGVNEIIVRGEIAGQVMALMGSTPSVLPFMQQMLGLSGASLLAAKSITRDEERMTWAEYLASARKSGLQPLALCQNAGTMSLQDVLDEGSALDNFIMELFERSGHSTQLGKRGPKVLVNPPDEQSLSGFDTILVLNPGTNSGGGV